MLVQLTTDYLWEGLKKKQEIFGGEITEAEIKTNNYNCFVKSFSEDVVIFCKTISIFLEIHFKPSTSLIDSNLFNYLFEISPKKLEHL
jgi:hypothetical protein